MIYHLYTMQSMVMDFLEKLYQTSRLDKCTSINMYIDMNLTVNLLIYDEEMQ